MMFGQTPVDRFKYKEKRKKALIGPGESISKKEPSKISGKKCAYTLFLVHLPYSTNEATIIHVFYRPRNHNCIIWVMDMRQNISSGVGKNLLWSFRIKIKCASVVIFLWYITKKKQKNTELSY